MTGMILALGTAGLAQPVITRQPENQTNFVGTTATFTVEAGGDPLWYQWQQAYGAQDFVDRQDATNATLVITNVQAADAGNYRVIVRNLKAVTSEVARLEVLVPPTIQFSASSYSVAENAGTVTLSVRRTGYLESAVTVDYATADATAVNGIKYTAISGQLAFGVGETNKTIQVPILNEAVVEGTKIFRVDLTNPGAGAVLGGLSATLVFITDNDQPIRLIASTFSVSEEVGAAEIGVLRGDDGTNLVTVDLATANSTALAGVDYEGVTNTLSFAPGEYLKSVPIRILNDGIRESTKSFRVTLSNITGGGQLGTPTGATVTITDTDEVVQLEHMAYYAGEGTGFVRIGVQRGESITNGAVDFKTTDIAATNGLDYVGLTNTLTFAPGETLKLIDIPILIDGLREATETFRVTLSNPTGGMVMGSRQTATINIVDNDPGVQFIQPQIWVRQQDGRVELTVTRGNDQLLDLFTVDYATTNWSAFAGRDYVETKGTLTFAAAEMTRTITVPLLDDGVARQDRTFKVRLSNPTGGMALGNANNSTATVTVCDMRELLPHRAEGLQISSDRTATLRLSGGHTPGKGAVNRFQPFIDIFPTEVSSNALDWSALVRLVRTNTVTTMVSHSENQEGQLMQRFYRVPARTFITPNVPPTGPYAVGRADRWLTDTSRRNRFFVSTNSSFQIAIWYPAITRAGSLPLPAADEQVLRDTTYNVGWTDRTPFMVGYAAGGLKVALSPVAYPVVLLSVGLNGVRHDLWEKGDELASHGYIVVAPDHFDAWGVVLPDGTYSSGSDGKGTSDVGFLDRVRDLRFIVDQLEQWSLNDPLFAGRVDLGKIAVIGFSWGGGVAAEFCRTDPRCRAAVVLEGYFQNATALLAAGLPKPVLSVYRSDSSDARLFDKQTRDAVWFQISNTAHLDIAGFGWSSGTVTGTRLSWEVNAAVNAYTVWFLDKYLKDASNPMPQPQGYPRIFNFKQK